MRFLIDADLPRSTRLLVERAGHEAFDVRDIGLGGADDSVIAAKAKAEGLCLLSGDFGFADVRNYPPAEYASLVVFELPKQATAQVILNLVESLLARDELLRRLPGRLAIVASGRVRLRPRG